MMMMTDILNNDDRHIVLMDPMMRHLPMMTNNALLNQARAGHRPVRAWFLRIASLSANVCICMHVCVCLCVCPRGYY